MLGDSRNLNLLWELSVSQYKLKDQSSEPFEVTPLDPENLKKVKVGDVVVVTATQSTVLSVDKSAGKSTAKSSTAKKTTK